MTTVQPDAHAQGLTTQPVDALRYEFQNDEPYETSSMLRDLIPEGSRVLDVGCGTGVITQTFQRVPGVHVLGVEPDETRAATARQRGLDVQTGLFDEAFVQNHDAFDVIVFADVLEHLAEPQALLLLARKALKPGGRVIVSVPNVAHWTIRFDILRGRFNYQPTGLMDATHLRWFTQESLCRLFESAGFQIVSVDHTAGVTLPDYQLRRFWRSMRPSLRTRIVRKLSRSFPLLFGSQHIIQATPRNSP